MPLREQAYTLIPSDRTEWTFSAPPGSRLAGWIEEFAHILKLEKAATLLIPVMYSLTTIQ